MPIATPQGTLDFKSVDKVTFVGASSNTVIDTTTGSLGVGVGVGGPTSNLHVVGNAYVSSNLTVNGNVEVGTENLFVDIVNSRVGIGTSIPGARLQVGDGLSPLPNTRDADGSISVYGTGQKKVDQSKPGIYHRENIGLGLHSDYKMSFEVNGSSSLVQAMIINDSGQIGIGTTSPANTLHISGTQNQLVQIQNTSDTARLVLNGSSGTGGDLIFKQAGTATWGIASIGDSLHFLGDDSTSQTRMTINNAGIVTTPLKPAFYAWDNTSSRSGTTLSFNSTIYNIGSHYSTSTNRFTAPVTGTYIFAAVIAHDTANTLADVYYSFYVNGSNRRDIIEGTDLHDSHYETHAVYIVNLNATDYVDIRARSGHNITFINGDHGAYYRNCFQGALLG